MLESRIICGDCEEVLKTLPDASIDCLFTDPPYGMNKNFGNESDAVCNFLPLLNNALRLSYRVLKNDSAIIIWCKPSSVDVVIETIKTNGFMFKRLLWMYKPNDVTFPFFGWLLKSEAIVLGSKGKLRLKPEVYDHDCYIFNHSGGEVKRSGFYHPSVKPLSVTEKIIRQISREGDVVLDPFLGSGTTALACEKLQRRWIGIEINPEYVEMAKRRLEVWRCQRRLDDVSTYV